MPRLLNSLVMLLAGAVLSGAVFTCSAPLEHTARGDDDHPKTAIPPTVIPPAAFAKTGDNVIADVAERVVQSVVNVSSEKTVRVPGNPYGPFHSDPFFERFFGPFRHPDIPRERRESSLGSGVVVSEDGVILTNNHVIANATKVQVAFANGADYEATVVGTDPASDLAVLRIKGNVKGLRPLSFGNSSALRLGEVVLAVGNPFGVGQTVTMGIVSAKGRANMGIVDYEDFIQTDAAINPGNSGGALVNLAGELVGVNTAILSRTGGYQGIGFAIPSNMARSIMESLLTYGKVVRGWLGVAIQDLDSELAQGLNIDSTEGVLIADVQVDSPAEKAGLKRGDVVVAVNGVKVDSTAKLRNMVASAGAGKDVTLDIRRNGKELQLKVTLTEAPQPEQEQLSAGTGGLAGLTLGSLTPEVRKRFRIPQGLDHGVVIIEVEAGSAAHQAGFRPGDVIREVNRVRVSSVAELRRVYESAGNTVVVLLQRGRSTLFLALRKNS